MIGPGKYDDIATDVRERTKAKGVIVIVFDGDRGTGFSMQADLVTTLVVPDILDSVAMQIRRDVPSVAPSL
jgi:hypothetical protein